MVIFTVVFSVGGGTASILAYLRPPVPSRELAQPADVPLSPADFQIRLMISGRPITAERSAAAPRQVHSQGRLGKMFLSFELNLVDDFETVRAGRGGGGGGNVRYVSSGMTIGDMDRLRAVSELRGSQLEFTVPKRLREFGGPGTAMFLDLYIRGKHYKGSVDEDGRATAPIS